MKGLAKANAHGLRRPFPVTFGQIGAIENGITFTHFSLLRRSISSKQKSIAGNREATKPGAARGACAWTVDPHGRDRSA